MSEQQVFEKHREIAAAERRAASSSPWAWAAVYAAAAVGLGYSWFKLPGAIGGAVVGFFIGQSTIHSARVQSEANLKQLREELTDLQESAVEDQLQPRFFSNLERSTGEADREFGLESAFANRMQQYGGHARTN